MYNILYNLSKNSLLQYKACYNHLVHDRFGDEGIKAMRLKGNLKLLSEEE